MKVPPKRKGNRECKPSQWRAQSSLNESPSEKEGKSASIGRGAGAAKSLNESPSEKEGKFIAVGILEIASQPQ